ncbi:ABC transporter ATP-binding protein, partial [Rhizobium leguminosarum]
MAERPRARLIPGQDQRTILPLINIRNLGVTLGSQLFSKLNLVVNGGDRIGLVAANGRGKPTPLAC